MRIAALIARILLGIVFLVLGLNGFLHFIPMGPLPEGPAGQFMNALIASHYTVPVFLLQLVSAVLFLINRYVPLALTLMGPIIVNIFLFHVLMAPAGLPLAFLVVILWLVVAFSVRSAFTGIFQPKMQA